MMLWTGCCQKVGMIYDWCLNTSYIQEGLARARRKLHVIGKEVAAIHFSYRERCLTCCGLYKDHDFSHLLMVSDWPCQMVTFCEIMSKWRTSCPNVSVRPESPWQGLFVFLRPHHSHTFTQQTLSKSLLGTRPCSRGWAQRSEQEKHVSVPWSSHHKGEVGRGERVKERGRHCSLKGRGGFRQEGTATGVGKCWLVGRRGSPWRTRDGLESEAAALDQGWNSRPRRLR